MNLNNDRSNIEKGIAFENLCVDKLHQLGFCNTQKTKNTDYGADIVENLGDTKYVFQCKYHKKKQGNRAVQEVLGSKSLYKANRCAVISESGFTKQAYCLAKSNYCILIKGVDFFNASEFLGFIKGTEGLNLKLFDFDVDLIKPYEELKLKIGHTPRNSDLDPTMRYHIVKKYGGLTEFIKHIGDVPFSKRPSNEQIKQEYLSIRNRIKRIPTLEDITTNSKLSRNCFSAYPFTKLQKECGDSPNIERGISKVELIKAYWELRTKLKHFPSQQDLDKHGIYKTSYYRLRFGSFNNFLKEVNLTKTAVKMQRQYSKSDLITMYAIIENLFKVKEENPNFILNQTVLENLKYTNKGLLIPATISKRFSGWNKFQIKYRTIPEIKQFTDKLKNLLDEFKNREWGLDN